jgi:hypothetical protein
MRPSSRRPALRALRAATLASLLAAAACVDVTAPDGGDGGGSTPGSGSLPAALAGAWRWGSISPTNFWNDHTGTFSGNAYGMSDHYVFRRDGTFTEYVYIYTQSYGCRTQVWVEMAGAVRADDETFTTEIARGRFKSTDTCAASRNFDRAMTESERRERSKTRAYALRTDASGVAYLQILDGRYDRAD